MTKAFDKGIVKVEDNSKNQSIGDLRNQELRSHATIGIPVTLQSFFKKPQYQFLSFIDDEDKRALKSSMEDLVFNCHGNDKDYYVDTGNYIGKIRWPVGKNYLDLEIGSRFKNIFLQRMINFSNDVYWDDFDDENSESSEDNTAEFILHYLFIQALEKAYLLGLPRSYQSVEHHQSSVKGKIDINQFIRRDVPFKGKVSSVSREQLGIPEIVDVLYKAVSITIKSNNNALKSRVNHIIPHLKQARTNNYVTSQTIYKAKTSQSLNNPIFSAYKKVLNLAEMVINQHGLRDNKDANEQGFGFLLNVAELFEVYVTKLLQKEFPDWSITSPSHKVYGNTFFVRKIIPDIVMTKGDNVLVFDTKYKRMKFRGTEDNVWDVDRNDFFQIHTYLSYYLSAEEEKHKYNVLAAGLLYPLSGEYIQKNCQSNGALGDNKTLFVIDGIELSELEKENQNDKPSMSNLILKEQMFIERIRGVITRGIANREG